MFPPSFPPNPQLSKLTGKTAIRVIFILFSLLGIYLTAENRDWTKIVALGGDCYDGTFCSLCVLYKGLAPPELGAPCLPYPKRSVGCLELDQEAEFSTAASRGCPCQIRTGFSVPEQLKSHFLPGCPFFSQRGLRFDPRSI